MKNKQQLLAVVLSAAALISALPLAAQTPAPVDERVNTLEKKVNSLDGKMDQVLQLLQKQASPPAAQPSAQPAAGNQQPAPAPSQPTAAPTAETQTTMKSGPILEAWALKPDFTGEAPQGRSAGALIDKGELFALSNFTAEPSLASMAKNRVALKWSGFFVAKEAGEYSFVLEFVRGTGNLEGGYNIQWNASLDFNKTPLQNESVKFFYAADPFSKSFMAEQPVSLEPGLYPFSLSTILSHSQDSNWNYSPLKLLVKVRGPSDLTPRALTSKDLLHKE